ncbi:TetR/AcrR family transcriptional regulator [Pseudooceanicola sp. CBS1P-1]|uniref:TetR family transcriptional regulator n=1 Tax=Pseudooceanicola albus TaxID=2692189 RepID=A0A6L7G6V8_9RHOB|nr:MULTISPECIES: TetR/AcrR family transcriptional regulator [Pseudooceanicola]MBT9384099.1 TetR/AcrR family transcriptional regulator [Pseudooceanicola endophyticus]MXN19801.1 TetR family transcriptional regulator [Pseudooceanicola albus]
MTDDAVQRRRGRKYDQVLEGARKVFLQDGFDGACVDDIAREAKVSKATLYSYFPDKRLLFIEVARLECRRQASEALTTVPVDLPAPALLEIAATRMVDYFCSPMALAIFRICTTEADRFPDLALEFYESGPEMAHRLLSDFLRTAAVTGEMAIADPDMAAHQFVELCRAGFFVRMLFGLDRDLSLEERARVAREAVDTFLARYGAHRSDWSEDLRAPRSAMMR